MNLDIAKKYVFSHLNKKNHFIYYGSRNQIEEFFGFISKLYPSIFLIELEDGTQKTFSYNDIITNHLKIIY